MLTGLKILLERILAHFGQKRKPDSLPLMANAFLPNNPSSAAIPAP